MLPKYSCGSALALTDLFEMRPCVQSPRSQSGHGQFSKTTLAARPAPDFTQAHRSWEAALHRARSAARVTVPRVSLCISWQNLSRDLVCMRSKPCPDLTSSFLRFNNKTVVGDRLQKLQIGILTGITGCVQHAWHTSVA